MVIGAEPRQGAVTRDGRGEVVAGMIIMLKGENSREVVTRVKETLANIHGTLPEGVRVNVFYDRTALIEACISTVMKALLEGSVLVIVILFIFIAELRTALIVVLALPLTFLVSFIIMGWAGLSSNLMSLGGLAFSVGMVVDASIVVIENIRRQLATRLHAPRRTVILEAVLEVGRPVAFSVMIIAIILVPLFTLQGIEGKMFAPLALTLLIALLVSLGVAFTTIPVLADLVLQQAVPEADQEGDMDQQPDQPGQESLKLQGAQPHHGGIASDRGHRPRLVIAERLERLVRQMPEEIGGGPLRLLDGDGGDHGIGCLALPLGLGTVTDCKNLRMPWQLQGGLDQDTLEPVQRHIQDARQAFGTYPGRPDHGPGGYPLPAFQEDILPIVFAH